MKHLARLERSKDVWFLILFLILFFFLRLPSLIEPHWYGDEGVYETLAVGINQGELLYKEIWDNKPPLLYLTYALFQADQFWVRFASLLSGVLAIFSFFFLSKEIFKKIKPTFIATSVFTILFGLPTIEGNIANAENFMLLPIIAAGYLIYKTGTSETHTLLGKFPQNHILLFSGILLGIAFLYKIVALFDFAAFTLFLIFLSSPSQLAAARWKKQLAEVFTQVMALALGFVIPFVLSLLYFLTKGGLSEYINAIFFSNVGYVGNHNEFLFPQGLLIIKIVLLMLFTFFLFWKRNHIKTPLLFISLWVAWSLFNAYFSQRPYTHYLLVLLPSFSLVAGLLATRIMKKVWVILALCALLFVADYSFYHWDVKKTVLYYENFLSFVTQKKEVEAYQSFFDGRVPHDMSIVSYLNTHLSKDDSVFIWSNSPQIYAQVKKTPPGRFTVAYHILSSKENIEETEKALEKTKPKFIIVDTGLQSMPFPMYNYTHTITLNSTEIYERLD